MAIVVSWESILKLTITAAKILHYGYSNYLLYNKFQRRVKTGPQLKIREARTWVQ